MREPKVYADTSFLMSHFINDIHTDRARFEIFELNSPILISRLGCLEFHNSVWRKVGEEGFKNEHALEAIREFQEQFDAGWFFVGNVDEGRIWERAMGLATMYSAETKVRSLDILHLSEAIDLGATHFWGFDKRQNHLAGMTGLRKLSDS